eukprot:TRINITY_DN8982_c0_g1_i1.p1 TRINITY_DN8982_c0_g1~~TRINITY_DN8982_c0_g1_i1.p1  ORF type:complete len:700 (+),score=170.49 TRINITY_DN8982_c0_g1_i1:213-2312(+)
MPGLGLSSGESVTHLDSGSPRKSKKVKASINRPRAGSPSSEKEGKKKSKRDKRGEAMESADSPAQPKVSKRKKSSSLSDDEHPVKKVKLQVVDVEDAEVESAVENGSVGEEEEINPMAVSNFKISEALRLKLKDRNIEALFPIQAQTYNIVIGGEDLVGRARTGQGKTLAFVLPILESLTKKGAPQNGRKAYGRAPSVIVLAPTRELAKQVFADFDMYGNVVGLSSFCVYGGSQYAPQENALKRGVDIVVGTPGRIKDLFERGTLNLKTLKFRVLDEADEMLNMGFVDDVEKILGGVEDSANVQTLLFSATMPDWVKKIAAKFLKPSRKTVDLVGDDKMKASASVRHILMPCPYAARSNVVADIISCYSSGGKTIVFTETKNDASELAGALSSTARALHGDIAQAQREVTMQAFRNGKFQVLVATDVAARGLDVNDVQLVIQCEPPRDAETYIHRSGRTGRAGNTGVSVMLYDRRKEYMVPMVEKKAGFKFERIAAPQPADLAKAAAIAVSAGVSDVSDSILPLFRKVAQDLIDQTGLSAVDVLAKALAKISGHTEMKRRSLLTSYDDATTLILQAGIYMQSTAYAFNCLKKILPDEVVRSEAKRMTLSQDGYSAVFDLPTKIAADFTAVKEDKMYGNNFTISIAETLPELQVRAEPYARGNAYGGRGYGGGGRGGYSGRGGSHGGRGGGSGGGRSGRW